MDYYTLESNSRTLIYSSFTTNNWIKLVKLSGTMGLCQFTLGRLLNMALTAQYTHFVSIDEVLLRLGVKAVTTAATHPVIEKPDTLITYQRENKFASFARNRAFIVHAYGMNEFVFEMEFL
jgi:hypothetical protein